MINTNIKSIYFLRLLRNLFVLIGIFFSICIVLALTTQPFWGYHWLGTSKSELKWEPQSIVLLGGGGMPSQSALMRSWYVEKAAKRPRVIMETPIGTRRIIEMPLEAGLPRIC